MAVSIRKAAIAGGFGAGVGASIAMMVVMAVLRLTTNTASIPELMEESLIRITGGQVESFFINNLGVGGKALLLTCIVEGTLLLGGLLGLAFTHLWLKVVGFRVERWMQGTLFGLLLGLLLNAVFLPLVNQGFFGSTALQVTAPQGISQTLYGKLLAPIGLPVAVNMFLLSVVFGLALVAILKWPVAAVSSEQTAVAAESSAYNRRDIMRAGGGALLAIVAGGALWGIITRALQPPGNADLTEVDFNAQPTSKPDTVSQANPTATNAPASTPISTATAQATQAVDVPKDAATPTAGAEAQASPTAVPSEFENVKAVLVPTVTPVDKFYITTKNFIDPTVDGNSWKLSFEGMADNPYSITLKDLQAMPAEERQETLSCISNPVGGDLIGNANWKGVKFADLIRKAKPQQGTIDVVVRAADGYADSFPLDVALNNDCLLAYEMNGKPLTDRHGYPARLLVPNVYGMKNCKWITQVQFVDRDFKGYWEEQGWDDVAVYHTLSRIDYPNQGSIPAKPIYVGGIAFAGNRGIKKVEVSTDGGQSWNEAQIRIVPSQFSWVLWTYPWKPKPGTYTLQVRATDGTGQLQTAEQADTYPNGSNGYHTRMVQVAETAGYRPAPGPAATVAAPQRSLFSNERVMRQAPKAR